MRLSGLSTELENNPTFKSYTNSFGYKYHDCRTAEVDSLVEAALNECGGTLETKAMFLVSQDGRYMGDRLDRNLCADSVKYFYQSYKRSWKLR